MEQCWELKSYARQAVLLLIFLMHAVPLGIYHLLEYRPPSPQHAGEEYYGADDYG